MIARLIAAGVIAASAMTAQAAVCNILDFGAVSDTTRLSTAAVQGAIDACAAQGGGTVLVPAGNFKTGSIMLKSNVTLHLENGATLYGSTDIRDYTPVSTDFRSFRTIGTTTVQLVYADGQHDVAITGQGTIDGRGRAFPKLTFNDEGMTRPHLLRFINCRRILVDGVKLTNSGCWMQHYLGCEDVKISNITVHNRNNYNNDALDLDGCRNVTVSNMTADSDDDGITLKSTSPLLCEDITITNCTVSSLCNAIKLGTETNGGFRNIVINGITVKPSTDPAYQYHGDRSKRGISAISLEITDGGIMENVDIGDIMVTGTESPIFIRLADRARAYDPAVPVTNVGSIDGVTLHDIRVIGAGRTGSSITGVAGHPVRNIDLRNIHISMKGNDSLVAVPEDEKIKEYPEATMWGVLPAKGFWLNHTHNVRFSNVTVTTGTPDPRPAFLFEDSTSDGL